MQKIHAQTLEDYTLKTDPLVIAKWKQMIEDWEHDVEKKVPDPYSEPELGKFV